jgi:hypothetical protein
MPSCERKSGKAGKHGANPCIFPINAKLPPSTKQASHAKPLNRVFEMLQVDRWIRCSRSTHISVRLPASEMSTKGIRGWNHII